VKIFNAIVRLITNPVCAVIVCALGATAMWFSLPHPTGSGPKTLVTGDQPNDYRAPKDGRPSAVGHGGSLVTETGAAQKSRNAPTGIVAGKRAQPGRSTGEGQVKVEEFEAVSEPGTSPPEDAPAIRPQRGLQSSESESTTASTADVIGPHDPRAKALMMYKSRKTGVAADFLAEKRVAQWCDERGLWDAAKTHWEAVLRLAPNSDEARQRLGFRLRSRQWVFDAASADEIAQKKADAFWGKELKKLHSAMRCRSKIAVTGRAEAVAQVEAVGDPLAAAAIWDVFWADAGHHAMMVGILSRFGTRKASQMLAAMAVYSQDKKAQVAAVQALRGRRPADYGERLVALMHAPLRVEERQVPILGRGLVRQLLVEGDAANYQFLFSRAEAPTSESVQGCFQPRLSSSEIGMARQFNENQARVAKQAVDQQIELAKQMIAKYNDSIQSLNDRVASVLNDACGAGIRPDPADGRRWLALALGGEYKPEVERPKPTFTQILAPLYNPTFLPVPVAT